MVANVSPPPPFWFSGAEFLPYVFQVMSLLLEIHSNSIPSSYMALFPHLLQPVLWERTGNIPPLVRLLQAYLEKGGASIAGSAADKIVRDGRRRCVRLQNVNVLVSMDNGCFIPNSYIYILLFIHCVSSILTFTLLFPL